MITGNSWVPKKLLYCKASWIVVNRLFVPLFCRWIVLLQNASWTYIFEFCSTIVACIAIIMFALFKELFVCFSNIFLPMYWYTFLCCTVSGHHRVVLCKTSKEFIIDKCCSSTRRSGYSRPEESLQMFKFGCKGKHDSLNIFIWNAASTFTHSQNHTMANKVNRRSVWRSASLSLFSFKESAEWNMCWFCNTISVMFSMVGEGFLTTWFRESETCGVKYLFFTCLRVMFSRVSAPTCLLLLRRINFKVSWHWVDKATFGIQDSEDGILAQCVGLVSEIYAFAELSFSVRNWVKRFQVWIGTILSLSEMRSSFQLESFCWSLTNGFSLLFNKSLVNTKGVFFLHGGEILKLKFNLFKFNF